MLGQFLKAKYKTSDVTAIKEHKHTPWVKQIESVQPWLPTGRVASLKQAHISQHHCSDHHMWMKGGSLAHGIHPPPLFFCISHHNTEGKIIALVDQVSCFRSSWGCLYIFFRNFFVFLNFQKQTLKRQSVSFGRVVQHFGAWHKTKDKTGGQLGRKWPSSPWLADLESRCLDWDHYPFQKSVEQWPAGRKMQHGGLGMLRWKTGGVLLAEVWLWGLSRRDWGITRKTQEPRH